jgi:hypothetical protein
MQYPIEQISDWLETKKGHSLFIRKQESNDTDQVELNLQEISLGQLERPDIDGYLASHTIILYGEGKIRNSSGEEFPLPQGVFEIPLDGTFQAAEMGEALNIQTGRAHYVINTH